MYKSTAQVTHYGKTGEIVRVYEFVGLYPLDVQAITVDWDTADSVEQFDVSWAYDYWQVSGGTTGSIAV